MIGRPSSDDSSSDATSRGPVRSGSSIGTQIVLALVGVSVVTLLVVGMLFFGFIGRYVIHVEQQQLVKHVAAVAQQVERIWGELPMRTAAGPRTLQQFLRINLQILPDGAGITVFKGSDILAYAGPARAGGEQALRYRDRGLRLAPQNRQPRLCRRREAIRASFWLPRPSRSRWMGRTGLALITLPTSDAIAPRAGLLRVLLLSGNCRRPDPVLRRCAGKLAQWPNQTAIRRPQHAWRAATTENPWPGRILARSTNLPAAWRPCAGRCSTARSPSRLRCFRGPRTAHAAHVHPGFLAGATGRYRRNAGRERHSAAAIHRESTRLRRLVDSLLTLSRYDSREFRPNLIQVDAGRSPGEEVDRLVEAGLAPAGRVTLRGRPGRDSLTDPDMLRQVVANLLRNAVQYGGRIPMTVQVDESGQESSRSPSPTAASPLGPEDRAHIFERFYRGRSAYRTEGFGLGLPLVKEICEVLGGRVELVGPGPRRSFG